MLSNVLTYSLLTPPGVRRARGGGRRAAVRRQGGYAAPTDQRARECRPGQRLRLSQVHECHVRLQHQAEEDAARNLLHGGQGDAAAVEARGCDPQPHELKSLRKQIL